MCQQKQHSYCRAIRNGANGGITMCRADLKTPDEQSAGFCNSCDYPGIASDHQYYKDLRDEGYSQYEAALKAGLADPT